MKTKPMDVPYCGVDRDKIEFSCPDLNWENVYHFKKFVMDRYRVHVKKDVSKLPAPWTKNPIIREFRFTNVRREHDRQTKYLIDSVVNNSSLSLEDKIVNCFMFRAWNNYDTFHDFGFPYTAKQIYNPKLKEKVRKLYKTYNEEDPKRLWWSNAYNQGGTKAAWKFPEGDGYQRAYKESEARKYPDWEEDIPLRPFHVGVWLGKERVVERLLNSKDQQECFDVIKSIRGFADFLAYQVFVDLTYIEEFPFSENEFVIAGPGCKKGLDLIFNNTDGMNYSECMFWLKDDINSAADSLFNCDELIIWCEQNGKKFIEYDPGNLFIDLERYDRCMNVMSIENCMCELSKYIRAVNGTGRPRNKYKERKDE